MQSCRMKQSLHGERSRCASSLSLPRERASARPGPPSLLGRAPAKCSGLDDATISRAMRDDDGIIKCDRCGCGTDTDSEERAEAHGWLVDRGAEPHAHICPACREAARP